MGEPKIFKAGQRNARARFGRAQKFSVAPKSSRKIFETRRKILKCGVGRPWGTQEFLGCAEISKFSSFEIFENFENC